MRRLACVPFLLALAAAGCDDAPIEPSPNAIAMFTAALTTANEVPPVMNVEAGCVGNVTIRITDLTRNASQVITAGKVDFSGNVANCPSAQINFGHIHEAVVSLNGDIVVNSGLVPGLLVLVNGAGTFAINGREPERRDFSILQRMLDNPSGFYFNLHSTQNPNGVIRGQLVRTQ